MNEEIKKEEIITPSEDGEMVERIERIEVTEEKDPPVTNPKKMFAWVLTAVVIVLLGVVAVVWIANKRTSVTVNTEAGEHKEEAGEHKEEGGGHSENEEGQEVKLDPEVVESAGLEYEGVTQRPAIALLDATGTIETNPQQTQSVTPLVGGRVERMSVGVGDFVQRGATLAVVASPQIAQMHGKLHEAETALGIAERNYQRVQKAENRVAVLQAKAKLDEAEATLRRTRRLIELGAGAGKDLIAAETNYKTAKADYDFQSNISLNKEIQESRAAVETARVDVKHIRDEMRALGVNLASHENDREHSQYTALVPVIAPASGMITERPVNPGAGVEAGTTLFNISNLSSVYAVANVPEAQMPLIRIGTVAEIRSPALGESAINARVAYIDPRLNEDTRTGKVRLEVPNPAGTLRAGMFVEVGFQTGTGGATGEELVVRTDAIQRVGEKTVVFVPRENEPGAFEVREVETGLETNGYTRIKSGLELGERVVTKGSFTLKTQMQKGEMGDHH